MLLWRWLCNGWLKGGFKFWRFSLRVQISTPTIFLTLFECVDKNECDDNTCLDKSSKCVNIPGSFYCSCVDGFEKNSTGICVPATCTKKSCSHNAYCSNDKCTCLPGWTGNGIFCERTLGWCKVKKIFTMINK